MHKFRTKHFIRSIAENKHFATADSNCTLYTIDNAMQLHISIRWITILTLFLCFFMYFYFLKLFFVWLSSTAGNNEIPQQEYYQSLFCLENWYFSRVYFHIDEWFPEFVASILIVSPIRPGYMIHAMVFFFSRSICDTKRIVLFWTAYISISSSTAWMRMRISNAHFNY